MIIFLRRIPANTKKSDIIDFVEPAVEGGLFQKTGHIEDVTILVLKDHKVNALEFHGLVTVDSETAFQRAVNKLNGKIFKGKNIAVREFFERSWHNDRRVNFNSRKKRVVEKRLTDRRRAQLEIVDDISDQFSSSEGFHRKL